MLKSVDWPHYHVWTDALYARALARDAKGAWDRASHVRWCVGSAWTAFEMAAADVLDAQGLGNRFKDGINEAVAKLGLPAIDWGRGTWQVALEVYGHRKRYVHGPTSQEDLFPDLAVADEAIVTLRAAVKAVYTLAGKAEPDWVDDDTVPTEPGSIGFLTLTRGVLPEDPNRIRITYTYRGTEHEAYVVASDSDPVPLMQELLRGIVVPITVVRAYRGDALLKEWQVNNARNAQSALRVVAVLVGRDGLHRISS